MTSIVKLLKILQKVRVCVVGLCSILLVFFFAVTFSSRSCRPCLPTSGFFPPTDRRCPQSTATSARAENSLRDVSEIEPEWGIVDCQADSFDFSGGERRRAGHADFPPFLIADDRGKFADIFDVAGKTLLNSKSFSSKKEHYGFCLFLFFSFTLRLTKWSKSLMKMRRIKSASTVNRLAKVPSNNPNVFPYFATRLRSRSITFFEGEMHYHSTRLSFLIQIHTYFQTPHKFPMIGDGFGPGMPCREK